MRANRTYREMQDNDPVIGALLFSIEMVLREVEWRTEPSTADGADPTKAQFWADRVWECVNDMSMTWPQTVSGMLSFLPFGWAFMEIVYKVRGGDVPDPTHRSRYDDQLWGWRKFALRAQESLLKWEFDDQGGVQGFTQVVPGGAPRTIPMERGLLFRTTAARSNPEGRSVLRNAYRPWYFKKRIEEIEAIGIERDLAGIPVFGVPPEYLADTASPAQKAVLEIVKKIVRDIKRDEQEGLIVPREIDIDTHMNLWDLSLLSTGGRRQFDTDQIVSRYDQRIAMTVLADFILLGHEAVGSKSLGVSKIELFTMALSAWLDEVQSVMNEFAVPRLMKFNGVDPSLYPTLQHDEVKQADILAIGQYVRDITSSGVAMDPAMEEELRAIAGLPQPEVEQAEV